jgi:hypothetical protein
VSPNYDGLSDLKRHQILTERQRPAIGRSRLGDNIVNRRWRNTLAAEQSDMCIRGKLRRSSRPSF